jgi:hypothetical protein
MSHLSLDLGWIWRRRAGAPAPVLRSMRTERRPAGVFPGPEPSRATLCTIRGLPRREPGDEYGVLEVMQLAGIYPWLIDNLRRCNQSCNTRV